MYPKRSKAKRVKGLKNIIGNREIHKGRFSNFNSTRLNELVMIINL